MLILGFLLFCCPDVIQNNLRKSVEANMSLLEKDKIMIQHKATEQQRKAEQEAEKRRNQENEGEDSVSHSRKQVMKLTRVCLLRVSGKTILEINLHSHIIFIFSTFLKMSLCVHHELSFKPWVD